MTIRIDLRGYRGAAFGRRVRALAELASLAAKVAPAALEVVADGDAAFAARLAVEPGTRSGDRPCARSPGIAYRAFGEANPAPIGAGAMLVEAGDLGRIVDREDGPAEAEANRASRLRALADAEGVAWRVAADWQAQVLQRQLGVPEGRILKLPARVPSVSPDRLESARLPAGLPADYVLCLTPVGGGDLDGLVGAHRSLGEIAPPLVILGVADEAWRPALARAVDRAGSRGRVLVLRDLDSVTEVAAIARARAVVALDRHPAHAVRLRQAAGLRRPAAVRRHPGHAAWVDGGRWFDDDAESLAAALRQPEPIRLRDPSAASGRGDPLASWLVAAGTGRRGRGAAVE